MRTSVSAGKREEVGCRSVGRDGRGRGTRSRQQVDEEVDGVDEVAQYLLSLSGRATIAELAEKGKAKYDTFCVACHGLEGKGNPALGAPNLTDDTWLYGGSLTRISQSIAKGRNGQMPAHSEFLGEAKVHLLAAYVYGLSQEN